MPPEMPDTDGSNSLYLATWESLASVAVENTSLWAYESSVERDSGRHEADDDRL